jgi:hypothetical protein
LSPGPSVHGYHSTDGARSKVIIRFLCKERISPEDIPARLEAQFRDATYSEYSERSVRRWCQYVEQGCQNLHTEVRSGKPPIDFLEIRFLTLLTLLDEQPFYLAYLIAESLGVSH